MWWCHCSVRCGYESASIWTLKQYLEKLPTFHVQFSFHCQGFPLVTKIFSLITKDFPLITKDFPFVKASNQPTEPFHIHSLLHPYVGMITDRLTQNKSVALDTSRRRVLWKLWISMRNKDWRTLLDSKEYGVCWADAGVTKARAHQLSSSRCSVTCYGAVQQQPAPTIAPRSGCAHCWAKCFQADWCNANIFIHSTCCHLVVIRVILPFITLHPLKMMVYILCTLTHPNHNTTYHSHFCPLHPPSPSLLPWTNISGREYFPRASRHHTAGRHSVGWDAHSALHCTGHRTLQLALEVLGAACVSFSSFLLFAFI